MSPELAAIPAQATLCRLAGVRSPPGDSDMYSACLQVLTDLLVEQSNVFGRCEYIDKSQTMYLSVTAINESGFEENVNNFILAEGLARVDADIAEMLPKLVRSLFRCCC